MESEKAKMLRGEWHLAFDKELLAERDRAKQLCWKFNASEPSSDQSRELLEELLPHSDSPHIERPFHCDYGYHIKTGRNFYANHGCTILDGAEVVMGDNVMLGPGVVISTPTHPLGEQKRVEGYEQAKPVRLGDAVWVGANATILQGVTIGSGAVIAAGAVVTKDVAPHTVVGGVPARVISESTNSPSDP